MIQLLIRYVLFDTGIFFGATYCVYIIFRSCALQSRYAYAPTTSTSVGGSDLTRQGSHAAHSSLASPSCPDTFSHYQAGVTLGSGPPCLLLQI